MSSQLPDRINFYFATFPTPGFPFRVKLSLCLTKHDAMKTCWGSGGIFPAFVTSSLRGGEWSASRPGRLIPGKPQLPVG